VVKEGFTFICNTLLSSGCLNKTNSGKTVVDIAMNSSLEHICKWGCEKEKPLQLEKESQRLLHILSIEDASIHCIKNHLVKSKYFNATRWDDCGYSSASEKEKPLQLEKEIQRLLHILLIEEASPLVVSRITLSIVNV
jgi:hypothetical protein